MSEINTSLDGEVVLYQSKNNGIIVTVVALLAVILVCVLIFGKYREFEPINGYVKESHSIQYVVADKSYEVGDWAVNVGDTVVSNAQVVSLSSGEDSESVSYQLKGSPELSTKLVAIDFEIQSIESEISVIQAKIPVFKELLELTENRVSQYENKTGRTDSQKEELLLIKESALKRNLALIDMQATLGDSQQKLNALRQSKRALLERLQPETLQPDSRPLSLNKSGYVLSPIEGVVSEVLVDSGDVVNKGDVLFGVSPEEGNVITEAYVNSGIASFLQPGQEVLLEYAAFPSATYGLFKGIVVSVDNKVTLPDEIKGKPIMIYEPSYRVSIKMVEKDIVMGGKTYYVKPGTIASGNILLSTNSFFEWLFKPMFALL